MRAGGIASRFLWLPIALLAALAAGRVSAGPPFRFVNSGPERGIGPYHMFDPGGGGAAAADFDDDGDVDLFVPNPVGFPDQLYRNRGDGAFEEIAAETGLAAEGASRCALWLDHDSDGDLDLLVAGDDPSEPTSFRLWLQRSPDEPGSPRFEDVTVEVGLFLPLPPAVSSDYPRAHGGLAAADVDRDGDLDLCAAVWNGTTRFFRNDGGIFTDVSTSSGIGQDVSFGYQPVMADIDGDRWIDIYLTVDGHHNRLWINQRDGTFVDRAVEARVGNLMNDMGVTLGDHDRDGDLDIYVTNIYTLLGWNVLFRNESNQEELLFRDTAHSAGVEYGGWGWGTTFLDADNDGWLDIATTNGWIGDPWDRDPSRFYWNRGGENVTFDDASADVRFWDVYWGSCLLSVDVDRDGDLDLVQTCIGGPLRLLENRRLAEAPGAHWLTVRPRMSTSNRLAVGAVARVDVGGARQMRPITAGTSFLGQEPAEAHFGLGGARVVEVLTVEWPDGRVSTWRDIAANRVITVTDEDAVHPGLRFVRGDCDGEGPTTAPVADALFLLAYLFRGGPEPPCRAACDVDGDGRVASGVTDAVFFLAHHFRGGPPPPAPSPECGFSTLPSDGFLGCERPPDHCG